MNEDKEIICEVCLYAEPGEESTFCPYCGGLMEPNVEEDED